MNEDTKQRLIEIVDELYKIAVENKVLVTIDTGLRQTIDFAYKNLDVYNSQDNSKVHHYFRSYKEG